MSPLTGSHTPPPAVTITAYGIRQTVNNRFSVVQVSLHIDCDLVGGILVERRRYTRHFGLPGSLKKEDAAMAKATKLANAANVPNVGFRADTL